MLSVTIQVTSGGGCGLQQIAHVGIINEETDADNVAQYAVFLDGQCVGHVEDFDRSRGWAALLGEALPMVREVRFVK